MLPIAATTRALTVAVVLSLVAARVGHAQNAAAPAPKVRKPAVCANGVRMYTDKSQVPVPHDTLTLPPADGPIRVTSPEEAEAAELALRGRAGSVGATGVLVTDEVTGDGDTQRIRRAATAVFVRADSARAQAACK
jgi:hypothetical protein